MLEKDDILRSSIKTLIDPRREHRRCCTVLQETTTTAGEYGLFAGSSSWHGEVVEFAIRIFRNIGTAIKTCAHVT